LNGFLRDFNDFEHLRFWAENVGDFVKWKNIYAITGKAYSRLAR
jgi:hypothetical protein